MVTGRAYRKNLWRSIRKSLGRYLAIMAIVALGVGFFAGLKVTKQAMIRTGDDYLRQTGFYDFRLLSTLGLTEEDVQAYRETDGIGAAEGSFSADFLYDGDDGDYGVLKAHLLPDDINTLSLRAGRMPQAADEVVADYRRFGEDSIGKVLTVSDENSDATKETFTQRAYTIVGVADSPYYLNIERGTTTLGSGVVKGFVYVPRDGLSFEVYTEIFVRMQKQPYLFSDAYREASDRYKETVSALLSERAALRYAQIRTDAEETIAQNQAAYDESEAAWQEGAEQLAQGKAAYAAAQKQYDEAVADGTYNPIILEHLKDVLQDRARQIADAEKTLADTRAQLDAAKAALDDARAQVDALEAPTTYTLTRAQNVGYACFENDSSIVDGIARVFPLFFFLVAALVCITTMTRMVEEQRTQIGTMRALGYTGAAIAWQYVFYAGSAALIGCVGGFLLGSRLFPAAIWKAYGILYGFCALHPVLDPVLALISLAVSLLCSVGATYAAVRRTLSETPAELMRPRAPRAGKRILMERIRPLWSRMNFLHKVSARNIFRYKKRMFMMILGIGGCTALLLTGLGIRDSISTIADDQFSDIMKYDYAVTLKKGADADYRETFVRENGETLSTVAFAGESSANVTMTDGSQKQVYLIVSDDGHLPALIDLHNGGKPVAFPAAGETVLTEKLAEDLHVSVGDTLTFTVEETVPVTVRVSGICENYVYSYLYLSADTYADAAGHACSLNTVYATAAPGADIHRVAASLGAFEGVAAVSVTADVRERVANMMESMNAIIWLVIACAGALALIVLFNLSNINITERQREIATIKVLGFYPEETNAYVFRESLVLTLLGTLFGMPLGILLHRFVMSEIRIDLVSFHARIEPYSFPIAIAVTVALALLVELCMHRKIRRVNMTESLKSIE